LEADVTDAHPRKELEHRGEQAETRTEHGDRDDLGLDRDRLRLSEWRAHLATAYGQVRRRLIEEIRDHLAREHPEFLGRRGGVAQAAQAVRDERRLAAAGWQGQRQP